MSSATAPSSTVHRLGSIEMRPPPATESAVKATCVPLRDVAALGPAWRDLETRADRSFFLSWSWIGTWLRHLPPGAEPHLLTARDAERVVGLALICRRPAWRLALRRRDRWLLTESGDALFDRLFVEYNGVLAERGRADAVVSACLEAAMSRMGPADRLVLSGLEHGTENAARRAAARCGLPTEVRRTETAPWVDLAALAGGDYRAALGRNTRQAVSRSMRLYGERGVVEHRVMATAQDALAAFEEMAALHEQRWGRAGAFANPAFRPFHRDLIARGVPSGAVRISRTSVAGGTVGVLYNFVHDGHVLNYQSGFRYESDNRLKPGLVCHVLAVEDAVARGERGYDFMAGAAGHKSRLATAERTMNWLVVGRDTVENRIEDAIRRAAGAVANRLPGRSAAAGATAGAEPH